jgi:hypothetical protein
MKNLGPCFILSYSYRQLVGLVGRGISPPQGCYLHRTTQTQNKSRQTSMPRVGFEPTIPVFERTKIIHALDRATTVIGHKRSISLIKLSKTTVYI